MARIEEQNFPLGSLHMQGAHRLDDRAIDEAVTSTSPGNFALGYMDGDTFSVFYVGRADSDLKRKLHAWVGAPSRFERYGSSAKAPWSFRRQGVLPLGSPRLARVDSCPDSGYTHFAFSYAPSARAAFAEQCRNYEDFGRSNGLDNRTQPRAALDDLG
jgi:hypothetical protein